MRYIEIEFWEIPLYVSVIVLLCVTVLYLIKERADRNNSVRKIHSRGKFGEFNEEIYSHLRNYANIELSLLLDLLETT